MCFSSILWLMVIDCLSVFLVDFDYLCFYRGKVSFFLLPFLSCIQFLLFWYSIFFLFFVLFFPPPTPGLRGASYTERNSTHVVL